MSNLLIWDMRGKSISFINIWGSNLNISIAMCTETMLWSCMVFVTLWKKWLRHQWSGEGGVALFCSNKAILSCSFSGPGIKIPLVKRWPCEIQNLKRVILRFQRQMRRSLSGEQSNGKFCIVRSQHHVKYVNCLILHMVPCILYLRSRIIKSLYMLLAKCFICCVTAGDQINW